MLNGSFSADTLSPNALVAEDAEDFNATLLASKEERKKYPQTDDVTPEEFEAIEKMEFASSTKHNDESSPEEMHGVLETCNPSYVVPLDDGDFELENGEDIPHNAASSETVENAHSSDLPTFSTTEQPKSLSKKQRKKMNKARANSLMWVFRLNLYCYITFFKFLAFSKEFSQLMLSRSHRTTEVYRSNCLGGLAIGRIASAPIVVPDCDFSA